MDLGLPDSVSTSTPQGPSVPSLEGRLVSQMGPRHVWLWTSRLGRVPGSRTRGPAGLLPLGTAMLGGRCGLMTPTSWQRAAVSTVPPQPVALVCSLQLPAGQGRAGIIHPILQRGK